MLAGIVAGENSVLGNYFGLDSSGEAIPQTGAQSLAGSFALADVLIYHGSGNRVGGTVGGSGNFFAHKGAGVLVIGQNAFGNIIQGNHFGRSVSGSKDFGKINAIHVENAQGSLIGGVVPGSRNRISAGGGISFAGLAKGNQCTGNEITNTDDGVTFGDDFFSAGTTTPSDNLVDSNEISFVRGPAVLVNAADDITIRDNTIHHNSSAGVQLGAGVISEFGRQIPPRKIRITGNKIYRNGRLGISLDDSDKPTPNDFEDNDDGPNGKMNFPVLGNPVAQPGAFRVEGSLSTNAGFRVYQIEFFANAFSKYGHGEGERFLGSLNTRSSDLSGIANFAFESNVLVKPGEFITATATDPEGNTSEFSKIVMARSGNDNDRDSIDNEIEDLVPDRAPRSGQSSIGKGPRGSPGNTGGGFQGSSSPDAANEAAGFGDGNGDGILDSQQANVASFQTIRGNWVTLVSPDGTTLENIEPGGPPEFDNLPAGFNFPLGFIGFGVGGVAPGGAVPVTCIFHDAIPFATAFGYGPLPDGGQPGWYQFHHDGQTGAVSGGGELTLNFIDGSRGDHDLQANGRITTLLGPALSGQLLNIATRLRVQTGENVLIGGFIITGTEPKTVMIRGIGPSLAQFFNGTLADPTLQLFQGNTPLASNNDWKEAEAEIAATGIPPSDDRESAIVYTLAPGFYTAVLQGNAGSTGIGVVEVYDLDQGTNSKLANIASRGFVDTGDNVMIGGLIVGPAGGTTAKVVVRAIGPTLTNFGINGALQDPVLDLVNANGAVVRGNDGWTDSQQAEIEAIGLQPGDTREATLIETLTPGNYTAIVRGAGGATGVGLVEVYNIQ